MKSKETGFQLPLDSTQIGSWIIAVYLIVNYYLLLLPLQDIITQLTLGISYTLLELLILYYGYRVTASNPTDTTVNEYRQAISQG